MKIILLNNVCKYNELVFATELIFGDNAKSNLKVPVGFLSQRCEPCGALFSSLTSKQDSRTGEKWRDIFAVQVLSAGVVKQDKELRLQGVVVVKATNFKT